MSPKKAARAAAPKTAQIHRQQATPIQAQIDRVRRAREQTALLITQGQDWMLPYLQRFNQELAKLEETQDLLFQATEIANHAAPDRAA